MLIVLEIAIVHYHLCFFPFPLKQDALARARWATKLERGIQATQKPWVPNKFSRVCSEHFVDGFPSADHPDPELKLGYETKVAKKRKHL